MKRWLLSLVFAALAFATATAENWPGFRGPRGDGTSLETGLPTTWSTTENIRWKLKLPSPGNASPVVWGDKIFLAQSIDKEGTQRSLLCIDRKNGEVLWTKTVEFKDKEPTHATNPYCSSTPVTDGERVYVSHGSAGFFCYDFTGKELWKVELGALIHIWGNASSPILWNDLVILNCGPGERTALRAFNKKTGVEVWKHTESDGKSGDKQNEWIGSWSTPQILKTDNAEQLIMSWPNAVKAHDPKTGEVIWSCKGLTKLAYTSPLVSKDYIVAMSGYGGSALAVKTGGKGDVTETHRVWLHPKNPQRIGSGIILGEHLYMANAGPGHIQCIELKTGKDLWEKQPLGANNWGSLLLGDGKLYATDQNGDTYVIKAEPKFEQIARNRMGEHVNSSLAISDGEIFLRTYSHLWCISSVKK